MFLVLGVIVAVTMLGVLGLMLAKRDNDSAGGTFGLISQRVVAVAGLQLAVARMQSQPIVTKDAINVFLADPTKNNIIFATSGTSPFSLSITSWWFPLASGSDQSAVQVKILGVGTTGVDGSFPIYLSSIGKGRDGESYEVRGVYKVRGLDYKNVYPTNGPTDGLLALNGLQDVNTGATIDGGIYSGKLNVTTKLQSGSSSCTFGRVRVAGDLQVYSGVTVAGNSIVGGKLKVSGNATFQQNLVVGYAAGNAAGYGQAASYGGFDAIDGSLTVNKSLYVFGTSSPEPINKDITVGGDFWMRDRTFNFGGHLIVGTSGTTTSTAWFQRGIYTTENSKTEIFGRLNVGSSGWMNSHQFGGWVYVGSDLEVYNAMGEYTHYAIMGTNYVGGNLHTESSVVCGANATGASVPSSLSSTWTSGGEAPCLNVEKKSVLDYGIKEVNREGSSSSAGLVFKGETYLKRTVGGQEWFDHPVRFEKTLSISGSLDAATFGSSSKKAWFFPTSASPRLWSYNGPTGYENKITNGTGTRRIYDSIVDGTTIVPTHTSLPTLTSLGYSADEQKLALADNPASEVRIDKLGIVKDFEDLQTTYATACGLSNDNPPTGSQLSCIYKKAVAVSGSPFVWNSRYLVVKIKNNMTRFDHLSGLSVADRVLLSGTKIFWIVDGSTNVNSSWYSGQKGSIQILYCTPSGALNNFGWAGDFYGFIQIAGGYSQIGPPSGSEFNLYGAFEISNKTGNAITMNSGANLNIYRNDPATKEAFSDIAGSFFSSDGVGGTGDNWVLRFNGDRSLTNMSKTTKLDLKDGWIQLQRIGEYR